MLREVSSAALNFQRVESREMIAKGSAEVILVGGYLVKSLFITWAVASKCRQFLVGFAKWRKMLIFGPINQVIMAQKGLTKKQFWIQMAMVAFWELYAVWWVVNGIMQKSTAYWIMGAVLGLLYLVYAGYLIYQRRRYPLNDEELDKQVGENFKSGMTGMGITFGIITVGFLIAFGLAALLK